MQLFFLWKGKQGMLLFVLAVMVGGVGSTLFILDKRKAVKGRRRISEKTLLTWAFFGAALPMFLFSRIIRHKTRVRKFKFLLPLFTLFHISAAVFIYWGLM